MVVLSSDLPEALMQLYPRIYQLYGVNARRGAYSKGTQAAIWNLEVCYGKSTKPLFHLVRISSAPAPGFFADQQPTDGIAVLNKTDWPGPVLRS